MNVAQYYSNIHLKIIHHLDKQIIEFNAELPAADFWSRYLRKI